MAKVVQLAGLLAVATAGGLAALALARLGGWAEAEPAAVLVQVAAQPPAAAAAPPTLDAAAVYSRNAGGVVTVYAVVDRDHPGPQAQGSGFVVSADGYVLTNAHVVTNAGQGARGSAIEPAARVFVEFADGERVPGRVVGFDPYADIGVIEVDLANHRSTPLVLGDSDTLVVGEPVAAIGSPFGQTGSLVVGVVSATGRSIASLVGGFELPDAIQTDAPINRGNSGGPLFNARGEVVGINAQIRTDSGVSDGVGFAVPINAAVHSLREILETGRVAYPWLGVVTRTVTPRLADRLGLTATAGAAVQDVVRGGPAETAGLRGGNSETVVDGTELARGGDVIIAIGGRVVTRSEDVGRILTAHLEPGVVVPVEIERNGERITVDVLLRERPPTVDQP